MMQLKEVGISHKVDGMEVINGFGLEARGGGMVFQLLFDLKKRDNQGRKRGLSIFEVLTVRILEIFSPYCFPIQVYRVNLVLSITLPITFLYLILTQVNKYEPGMAENRVHVNSFYLLTRLASRCTHPFLFFFIHIRTRPRIKEGTLKKAIFDLINDKGKGYRIKTCLSKA